MTTLERNMQNRVVLLILDGWGYALSSQDEKQQQQRQQQQQQSGEKSIVTGNPLSVAKMPMLDELQEKYFCTLLKADGKAVGLPEGQMGNSEVGHLTIGAGRIIPQFRTRIDEAIHHHQFESNKQLQAALKYCKSHSQKVHFIGLLSDGGVHSHQQHLYELLKAAKHAHIPHVYVHAILDGRDTPPNSASKYIKELLEFLDKENIGSLADVIGRNYAMDRDNKWDRIETAMKLYLRDVGITDEHVATEQLEEILQGHYDDGLNDQIIPAYPTHSEGNIHDGDTVILFNFRNDRMRQLTEALTGKHKFKNSDLELPKNLHVLSMVPYDETFDIPVMFDGEDVPMTLPEVIAKASLKQFHCAETEKYAHVTYFLAGMKEQAYPLEERKLVPSPKVDTYDKAPGMSTKEVSAEVCMAIEKGDYSFIVANFAALDMVAHTGNFDATVTACEAVDAGVRQIIDAGRDGWTICITGDHGNCEKMLQKGEPMTSHTTNPVRFMVINEKNKSKHFERKVTGGLEDVAPTVLGLLGVRKPAEMTGHVIPGVEI